MNEIEREREMDYPATGPSFLQSLKSLIKIEGVGREREKRRKGLKERERVKGYLATGPSFISLL